MKCGRTAIKTPVETLTSAARNSLVLLLIEGLPNTSAKGDRDESPLSDRVNACQPLQADRQVRSTAKMVDMDLILTSGS